MRCTNRSLTLLAALAWMTAACTNPFAARFPEPCDFDRVEVGWSGTVTPNRLWEGLHINGLAPNQPVDMWVSADVIESSGFRVFCMRVPEGLEDGPWVRGDVPADWDPRDP